MQPTFIAQSYFPRFPLNQFVKKFFYYEGAFFSHKIDRFLPDGNAELLIELTGRPQFIYDNDTLIKKQACKKGWISGVRTAPISIPSGHASRMLVVYFKKGMAYPFYNLPMNELNDVVVDADLLLGRKFIGFREKLLECQRLTDIFQLTECYLTGIIRNYPGPGASEACVQYAVEALVKHPQLIQFNAFADRIGYSQKHFIQLFKKRVGVTPKEYLRIMRFQKAIQDIEKRADPFWSRMAIDCGFYDQAHFIHEFKRFSGFTPEDYLKRKNGALNYVPVG